MVRLVFRPISEYNELFARQYRYEPLPEFSPNFALLRLSSPSFKSRHVCIIQTTFKITLEWKCVVSVLSMLFVCVCLLCVAAQQRMCVQMPQHMCKREVTLCVSELRTHTKIELFLEIVSTYMYICMSLSRFCSFLMKKRSLKHVPSMMFG